MTLNFSKNSIKDSPKGFQFVIVLACSTVLTLVTDAYDFRSSWNFTWYFGVPVALATICNAGWHSMLRMAAWLSAFSVLTIMLVGFLFGLGS